MTWIEIVVLIAVLGGVAIFWPRPQPVRIGTFDRPITGRRASRLVRASEVRYGARGHCSFPYGI